MGGKVGRASHSAHGSERMGEARVSHLLDLETGAKLARLSSNFR